MHVSYHPWFAALALLLVCCSNELHAQPHELVPPTDAKIGNNAVNAQGRTGGGMQFWTDQVLFHEWRIQRNVLTGHFRLLDPKNVRRAWGTLEQCTEELEASKRDLNLVPIDRRVVIVLHGLGRTRNAMSPLVDYLRRNSQFEVLNMGYASTREDLTAHAASLAHVIECLPDDAEINFVGHSMGNIVVRKFLGTHNDPRIKRFVMLAPPNQGAEFARVLDRKLFRTVMGTAAGQLTEQLGDAAKLAIPSCEFGIIAGSQTSAFGNPLLGGDSDLVVSVEETKLDGARDFLVVPCLHTTIMNDDLVQQSTLCFLHEGFFVSDESRQPILPADLNP